MDKIYFYDGGEKYCNRKSEFFAEPGRRGPVVGEFFDDREEKTLGV